jgi:hypothetical protein
MGTTESYLLTETKLKRVAWLSSQDPKKEFGCLMHFFNFESLVDCLYVLKKLWHYRLAGLFS